MGNGEELATSTKVAEAVAQELSRSSAAETGLPQLDNVLALRTLWIFIVAAWISRKCDPFLIVLVVSMVGAVAALPVADDLVQTAGRVLPGVAVDMDLGSLVAKMQLQPAHKEWALVAAAAGLAAVATALGWVISKRSPVAGLVLYILVFVCNAQSGVFDDYPVRVLAPLLVLALSAYSKHIRYLNLAAAVLATSLVATGDGDAFLMRDLAPLALWGGFALLLIHDVLVRARVIEGVAMLAAEAVVMYTVVFAMYRLLTFFTDARLKMLSEFFDSTLTWPQLFQLPCLPGCQHPFEASLPGVFCTMFSIVSILRDIVGGRSNFIKGITSATFVVATAVGVFVAAKRQALLYDPNVTSVVAVMAMLISERVSAAAPHGPGTDPGAHLTKRKQIGFHTNSYWVTRTKASAHGQASAFGDGLGDDEGVVGVGPDASGVRKGVAASQTGSGKRVHFAMSDEDNVAESSGHIPTGREMEKIWDDVNRYFADLEKAQKVHRQYKKMAFQQEAVANGVRSYDEASRAHAQREREKADDLEQKCREASTRVKNLERKAKKAMKMAQDFEQRISAAKADGVDAHAKST